MITPQKVNVRIYDDRTSITLNPHVIELLYVLDGTPTIQDLIDEAVDDYDMSPDGNVSQWVTSLIAVKAKEQIELSSKFV